MRFALCRKKLHELTPSNRGAQVTRAGTASWFCRACRNASRSTLRRLAKGGVLLDGTTRGQRISMARKAAWARQREAGYTGREAAMAAVASKRATPRQWCAKGLHRWVPENLLDNGRRKTCKWCAKATNAARRPFLAEYDRLRYQRINTHPDKGGTVEAFIAADRAWREFKLKRKTEAA